MLSAKRNKKAAKRFFKKALSNPYVKLPRGIGVNKNLAYLPAFSKLRQVRYLKIA
jgi:transposase-like protein